MRKFRSCDYWIVQFEFKCPTPNIIIMKFSPRTYDLTRKWWQNNVILSKISTRFARICHAIGKIQARIQEICNKDFKRHMILINIESDCLKIVCPLKSLLKISLDPCLAKYSVKKIRLAWSHISENNKNNVIVSIISARFACTHFIMRIVSKQRQPFRKTSARSARNYEF